VRWAAGRAGALLLRSVSGAHGRANLHVRQAEVAQGVADE
jgi:hypothetical protein